ncbi:hypothetical protein [Bacillus haynesii]|uniref:hypothetical protein n=1 Tax=Bacillus haynesii TaxID=1925021 RepID=UPI002DBFA8DC|nr:hypothetical protein [Bacillus haynesii]MEC1479236.1 hypothetical protein [Bacillus haynesii]
MLRKGDYVVMHSNLQARINSGVIWACECDEFLDNRGNTVIRLKDYNDVFCTAFLQKVDVQGMLGVALKRADKLQEEKERYKKALNRIAGDISVDTLEKAEVIAIEALEAAE